MYNYRSKSKCNKYIRPISIEFIYILFYNKDLYNRDKFLSNPLLFFYSKIDITIIFSIILTFSEIELEWRKNHFYYINLYYKEKYRERNTVELEMFRTRNYHFLNLNIYEITDYPKRQKPRLQNIKYSKM